MTTSYNVYYSWSNDVSGKLHPVYRQQLIEAPFKVLADLCQLGGLQPLADIEHRIIKLYIFDGSKVRWYMEFVGNSWTLERLSQMETRFRLRYPEYCDVELDEFERDGVSKEYDGSCF